MRLLGIFIVAAVFCVAHNPFKLVPLYPDPTEGSAWIVNPLALLLKEQYTKALEILGAYHITVKNTSSYSLIESHKLVNGAVGDTEIAYRENKDTSNAPRKFIRHSPNTLPLIPTTQTTPETHHTGSPTTRSIVQLSDSTEGTNGTSTAGNSASAKMNALGALLVFIGAAFALL